MNALHNSPSIRSGQGGISDFVRFFLQERKMDAEERLRNMPSSYQATYRTAMRGRSMKAAIKSFCLECVGYQREEIKVCTDTGCPLFPYRPTSHDYKAYSGCAKERDKPVLQPQASLKT
jgi:hypothetical protein